MDEFEQKSLTPMLLHEADAFDSTDYIYELKLDGIRCLAYLDVEKTVLINKRLKDVSNIYPELLSIHQFVKKRVILDGEIVIMRGGKPDFYQLQKRSLMTNQFKINLSSKQYPATFVAFDLLYLDDKLITELPLIERKVNLTKVINESTNLVVNRYIETHGLKFYELSKAKRLEGIVAKQKYSKYYPGKRSRVWLKIKVYQEDDYVICGYIKSRKGIKELILGEYDDSNKLVYASTVLTSKNQDLIIEFQKDYPSAPHFPHKEDDILWMVPHLVGIVEYMMKSKRGGLRQPVFKGVRTDKVASDLLK